MIRSLRFRFFVIVWPLVVAATVAVGWYVGRWTRVELRHEMRVERVTGLGLAGLGLADSVRALLVGAASTGEIVTGLERLASRSETAGLPLSRLFLADAEGRVLAAHGAPLPEGAARVGPEGALSFESVHTSETGERTFRIRVPGEPVELPEGFALPTAEGPPGAPLVSPVRLFAIPDPEALAARGLAGGPASEGGDVASRAGRGEGSVTSLDEVDVSRFLDRADRTIVTAVLLASVIAAIATLLLARPVVGRAGRLAQAARRIRSGDLAARVPDAASDELGDVERAFNEMARELERTEELKRRLVSDVAHELRTPLTNLVGTLEAMDDGLQLPDPETLASLREEVALLERLVEDLHEIAVAEAGALGLAIEGVDLRAACAAARDGFASEAQARGLTLEILADGVPARHVRGDEHTPPYTARADRQRLAQVLRNLIANAVRHSPEGGAVRVHIRRRGDNLDVVVTDEGPGIPPEHLDLIWERFYRVEAARDRERGGTGLGLAIVKRLVEAQDGRVWAESRPGEGAAFHFTLPAV